VSEFNDWVKIKPEERIPVTNDCFTHYRSKYEMCEL